VEDYLDEITQVVGSSPVDVQVAKKLKIDSDSQDEYIKEKIKSSEDIKE